jgi:hypothetical protein
MRVAVAFQPQNANAIIEELGDREGNHTVMISHRAR